MSRLPRNLHSWQDLAMRRPLPVQFALFAPNRSSSKTLCPALVVRANGIEVIRILDPEHKQPFFTLDGLFLLAGLTITEGLLRFALRRDRGDYDLTLAGLEPREAIWVPWRVAQNVAKGLELFELLQPFFAERHAWSLDEGEENGITHNWRAKFGSGESESDDYSLSTLLHRPFAKVSILPRGQQFRTFLSAEERLRILSNGKPLLVHTLSSNVAQDASQVEQRLLRWTALSVEAWTETQEGLMQKDAIVSKESNDEAGAWTMSMAELLLLISDMLHCIKGAAMSKDERSIMLNDGQYSISFEELKRIHLLQRDGSPEQSESNSGSSISLFLVNQLCSLYRHIVETQDEREEQNSNTNASPSHETLQKARQRSFEGRSDESRLQVLESTKRIEAMLKALLDREQRTPSTQLVTSNRNVAASSLAQSVNPYWVIALLVLSLFLHLFQQTFLAS